MYWNGKKEEVLENGISLEKREVENEEKWGGEKKKEKWERM